MTPNRFQASGQANHYRFGVLERRGVIAGFEGGQVASVACGVIAGVISLRLFSGVLSVAVALVAIAIGGVFASVPFGGRTGEQWFPTIAGWAGLLLRGRRKVGSPEVLAGTSDIAGEGRLGTSMPEEISWLSILSTRSEESGNEIGVIHDPKNRTLSTVIKVYADGFPLKEVEERNQRVAAWSLFLAGAAREGTSLRRVQWLKRSIPDQGEAVRSYFKARACHGDANPAIESYEQLLDSSEVDESRHETFVVISVKDGSPKGRGERAFGSLLREVASAVNQMKSCDLRIGGILNAVDIHELLTDSFAATGQCRGGWPFACRQEWDSFVCDGLYSATFWVSEWPRVEVGPDFLVPLLLKPGVRMAMSVVMEPLSPLKATKQVENAKVSRMADNELRRRGGFISTARRSREDEVLARRERELADGHGHYRFSGYVTVSATSEEELEDSCAKVLQAAAQSYLTLRRLYGEQAKAFTWTLPLGRGLS